jgi:hypothetical protein
MKQVVTALKEPPETRGVNASAAATGRWRPSKQEAFRAFLAEGWASLHLDARRPGVQVPLEVAGGRRLVLQYGSDVRTPISALRVNAAGVGAILSFQGSPRWTFVPWSAVYLIGAGDGRGVRYHEDVPGDRGRDQRHARLPWIEHLPGDRAARLPRWRDDWVRASIGRGRTDSLRAKAALCRLYRDIGEDAPELAWVESPRAAVQLWVAEQARQRRDRLDSAMQARLHEDLAAEVSAQLAAPIAAWVRGAFRGGAWGRITTDILQQLTIEAAWTEHAVPGPVSAPLPGVFQGFGAVDLDWVGFYACVRDLLGVTYSEAASARLAQWTALAQSCGWWLPCRGLCIVCERPPAVHWDPRGRLHHPRQAALCHRDGFGLHAWHGTVVPAPWITAPETLDPHHALTWPNLEQRRAAAEIVGWQRVLDRLSPVIVDRNRDPEIGQLVEVHLPGWGRARFLRVRCGTGRVFALSVPLQMRTALEANAWTYDLDPKLFSLEART